MFRRDFLRGLAAFAAMPSFVSCAQQAIEVRVQGRMTLARALELERRFKFKFEDYQGEYYQGFGLVGMEGQVYNFQKDGGSQLWVLVNNMPITLSIADKKVVPSDLIHVVVEDYSRSRVSFDPRIGKKPV